MKISFWIPAVVLYMVRGVFSNPIQVGTVLFTTTDLVKKCWTESDKSLLKARLIMQDVLPDPDCIDFSNPEAVAILLDYFHACYQVITLSTYGKLQNLMYLALSDALGGYLRAYVLPSTKRAYYAGQVKYLEAKKLFQLYDDIRVFLKTNGVGWTQPQRLRRKRFHVRPLVITGGALEACDELYVIEKQRKTHSMDSKTDSAGKKGKQEPPSDGFPDNQENWTYERPTQNPTSKQQTKRWNKMRRFTESNEQLSFYNFINSQSGGEKFFKDWPGNRTRGPWEGRRPRESKDGQEEPSVRRTNLAHTQHLENVLQYAPAAFSAVKGLIRTGRSGESLKRVIVPLPVLDDCQAPHSIAVPFVRQPFRNLRSGCSAFILEYYYLAVVKCFIAKGNSRADIKNFNGELYTWLVSQVVPHLSEEQWYPGFGGVLRVMQTIKKFGVEAGGGDPVLHDIAFMFNNGAEFEVEESFKEKGKNKVREVEDSGNILGSLNPQRHLITAVLIVSMIWLFIFCAFAFYCQATRGQRLLYNDCQQSPNLEDDRRGEDRTSDSLWGYHRTENDRGSNGYWGSERREDNRTCDSFVGGDRTVDNRRGNSFWGGNRRGNNLWGCDRRDNSLWGGNRTVDNRTDNGFWGGDRTVNNRRDNCFWGHNRTVDNRRVEDRTADDRWRDICEETDRRRDNRRGNDNINFQFLVRFFKRNNEAQRRDSDNIHLRIGKYKNDKYAPVALPSCAPPCSTKRVCYPVTVQETRKTGGGDCFGNFGSMISNMLPGQPYLSSFNKPQNQKFDGRSGALSKYPNKGQGDQIQMLWKKPSVLFEESIRSKEGRDSKRCETTVSHTGSDDIQGATTTNSCSACLDGEKHFRHRATSSHLRTTNTSSPDGTKGYTSEKQTSTCYCSEGCPFAHTTTTSSTQLERNLSSATMEFFEEVIAKHKKKKKCSTRDSTAESESECSTSSETDY